MLDIGLRTGFEANEGEAVFGINFDRSSRHWSSYLEVELNRYSYSAHIRSLLVIEERCRGASQSTGKETKRRCRRVAELDRMGALRPLSTLFPHCFLLPHLIPAFSPLYATIDTGYWHFWTIYRSTNVENKLPLCARFFFELVFNDAPPIIFMALQTPLRFLIDSTSHSIDSRFFYLSLHCIRGSIRVLCGQSAHTCPLSNRCPGWPFHQNPLSSSMLPL